MNTFFSGVSLVALAIGAVAIIVAFYKTNLGNATIKHQSDLIDTLSDKVSVLTTDLAEFKEKNTQLHARNQYLEGMVTGKQELTELLREVTTIRTEVSRLEGIMTQGPIS